MGDSKAALEQVRLARKALQEQQVFQAAALYRTALAMDPDQESEPQLDQEPGPADEPTASDEV